MKEAFSVALDSAEDMGDWGSTPNHAGELTALCRPPELVGTGMQSPS